MKPTPTFPLVTRFPPEPNGYLHLGHAKSILINFGLNQQHSHDGTLRTNVRFDDTNPVKESEEFAKSIIEDVSWLVGPDYFDGKTTSTSQHFNYLEECAEYLISQSLAYVDKSDKETIREMRGTLTKPGVPSPYRDTSPSENLELFKKMKSGSVPTGSMVLRLKIDMNSPNMNLRDPVAYRVLTDTPHQSTGVSHNIYPMYDFSHPVVDALEKISQSLCTLEFEGHRPLYEWVLTKLSPFLPSYPPPTQMEFSRLNLKYTVLSKRKLIQLVETKTVAGWDDPRLPTLSGVRRRGFTPSTLHTFCSRIGVSKVDSVIDFGDLENVARDDMDKTAPRGFVVTSPLKVTLTGPPPSHTSISIPTHPKDPSFGDRDVPFSSSLYVERSDFFDVAGPEGKDSPLPKGFNRLTTTQSARLRNAYVITVKDVVRDEDGNPTELICEYDPETFGGVTPEGQKRDPSSLHFQFERQGYYALDKESTPDNLVFNRVVTLKDAWSGGKDGKQGGGGERRRGNNAGASKGGGEVAPDHARVRITTARVVSAEPHPESDKLLVTKVECGEDETRTIVAGLAAHVSPSSLEGVGVLFCSNLKPARVAGMESNGMLLGVSKEDGSFGGLLSPPDGADPGSHLSFQGVDMEYDEMMKSKGAVKAFERFIKELKTDVGGVVNFEGKVLELDG
ncbi:hypothetical protein TrRE_jg10463, partial [Triparma retinervis]